MKNNFNFFLTNPYACAQRVISVWQKMKRNMKTGLNQVYFKYRIK